MGKIQISVEAKELSNSPAGLPASSSTGAYFGGALCHAPPLLTLLTVQKNKIILLSEWNMPGSFDGFCTLWLPPFKISRCATAPRWLTQKTILFVSRNLITVSATGPLLEQFEGEKNKRPVFCFVSLYSNLQHIVWDQNIEPYRNSQRQELFLLVAYTCVNTLRLG